MKKILAAIAIGSVMILGTASAYAWGGNGKGCCQGGGAGYGMGNQMGYGHVYYLKERAGLSDEQVEKIFKIDSDYRLKYYQNREKSDKLNTLRTEHKKAVEGVLSADQKKKLDEFYKDRGNRNYGYCPWR